MSPLQPTESQLINRPLNRGNSTFRAQLVADGVDVPRPELGDGAPSENVTDWLIRINALVEQLSADVPVDPEERDEEQQVRWILANILDWHRREEKSVWWEYFRLADLSDEDLMDERAGLSGLSFLRQASGTARASIHRYRFPPQETELRGSEDLHVRKDKLGKIEAISFDDCTVDKSVRTASRSTRKPSLHIRTSMRRYSRILSCGSASMWPSMACVEKGLIGLPAISC